MKRDDWVGAILIGIAILVGIALICGTFIRIATVNAEKSRDQNVACFASAVTAHQIRVCQGHGD